MGNVFGILYVPIPKQTAQPPVQKKHCASFVLR